MKYRFTPIYQAVWKLCNANQDIRNTAYEYLLDCGEKAVIPLIHALWHPEKYVFYLLDRRVDRLPDLRKFEHWDVIVRRDEITSLLIKIGSPAVQYLINSLFLADDYFLRERCANILRSIGDSRATIPILVAMLEEHNTIQYNYGNDSLADLYFLLQPQQPFQWSLWQYYIFGDFMEILGQVDSNFSYGRIEDYSVDDLLNLLPKSMIPSPIEKSASEIMEEALFNKIPLEDIETHIENCLILHKNLRPQYVLAVMHHNNFNLKDALAHYETIDTP